MPAIVLSGDLWVLVFEYLENLKEAVRAWIAFCLTKRGLSATDPLWLVLLEKRFESYTTLFLTRTAYPTLCEEKQGLRFFARIHHQKKCSRSGCYQTFVEIDNTATSCRFHPGRLNAAGILSCCRQKSFKSEGCRSAYHCGDYFDFVWGAREETATAAITHPGRERISATAPLLLPALVAPPAASSGASAVAALASPSISGLEGALASQPQPTKLPLIIVRPVHDYVHTRSNSLLMKSR